MHNGWRTTRWVKHSTWQPWLENRFQRYVAQMKQPSHISFLSSFFATFAPTFTPVTECYLSIPCVNNSHHTYNDKTLSPFNKYYSFLSLEYVDWVLSSSKFWGMTKLSLLTLPLPAVSSSAFFTRSVWEIGREAIEGSSLVIVGRQIGDRRIFRHMTFSSLENGLDLLNGRKIPVSKILLKDEEEVWESLSVILEIESDVLTRDGLGCLISWGELVGVIK